MNNKITKPTEAELQILQILWQNGPSTVRFVNEKLNEEKKTGYTTSLKTMQIMFEKKLVKRNEENKTHIYAAVVREEDVQKHLLDKFLDSAFKGSAMKLVMQALGNRKTSKKELDEIRALLDKIEKGGNK
ncbi:MAG: BlaI/MecI/CopY family transcriptional regulator [Bacteroidales bacterium]|nr:BlaI/MecI/CopY family transcriptional regulator [Bacteroidales bacterium]